MRPGCSGLVGLLLVLLSTGCSDDQPFEPERSVHLELDAAGLPEGASAEYRVFVQDTVAIAHGEIANAETDTVRVSSSAALNVQWQDARASVGEVDYVFAPAERNAVIEESDTDTTVAFHASYELVSGGFVMTAPGIPVDATAYWRAWTLDDSLLADGPLRPGEMIRRGDLPPGNVRLQLDTAYIELDGVRHAYAAPEPDLPLSVAATLELIPVEAPYALASVVVRMSPSGLPAGTEAGWAITQIEGDSYHSLGGSTQTGTVETVDLVRPGNSTIEWGEVMVDGVTYVPDPASLSASLEPRMEPYEFESVYVPAP